MKQKRHYGLRQACALLGLLLVIAAGTGGLAYGANLGGFRDYITLMIYGQKTTVEMDTGGDVINYRFTYTNSDGQSVNFNGRGIGFDENGEPRALSREELEEELAMGSDVEITQDGHMYLYFYGEKIDITNRFHHHVACIKLTHNGQDTYFTVREDGGFSQSHDGFDPNPYDY